MMRLLVLSVTLAMLATPARAAERNIVLFVADDHGTEAFGAYGNPVVKTPRLDEPGAIRETGFSGRADARRRFILACLT